MVGLFLDSFTFCNYSFIVTYADVLKVPSDFRVFRVILGSDLCLYSIICGNSADAITAAGFLETTVLFISYVPNAVFDLLGRVSFFLADEFLDLLFLLD